MNTTTSNRRGNRGPNQRFAVVAPGFAAYMNATVPSLGGSRAVGGAMSMSYRQVDKWLQGEAIPYLRTLIRFAETFELPVNDVLRAAGKPPIESIKEVVYVDHRRALPSMLHAYREDKHGGDTQAASDAIGVTRSSFSRYANGSAKLRGIVDTVRIARALELSVENVLDAAGEGNSPLRRKFESMAAGVPGYLRMCVGALGVDTMNPENDDEFAEHLGVSKNKLRSWLNDETTPTFVECRKISERCGISLRELLVVTGFHPEMADALVKALDEPVTKFREDLGTVLRTYRKGSGLRRLDVALAFGATTESAVTFYEINRHTPPIKALVTMARLYQAPLGSLLNLAGYTS